MKKYIGMALALLTLAGLGSCSKEDPFGWTEGKTGKLLTRSMTLSLSNEESVVTSGTRAGSPDVNDFTVDFIKEGETEPTESYRYAEMPEIVVLPVGKYTAVAHYGENPVAEWDSPYYKGESGQFEIAKDEVTDNVEPVVCGLANIKVTIILDDALREAVDEGCTINVQVGDQGSLDYTLNHINNGMCGFFAHVEQSHTLAATFHGNVQGFETHESKAYEDVAPGKHYKITFKLHSSDYTDPGYIDPSITVDATVEVTDLNYNIDTEDDILVDDMRPTENLGGDEPGPGEGKLPEIVPEAPVSFDKVNDVTSGMNCVLNVTSEAEGGIQKFMVYIDSETLTEDVLSDVGLGTTLDMVNPGAMEEGLRGLPLPVMEQVKGQHSVRFDITSFMDLLGIYGAANHKFTLEVTDANGTTKKVLQLRTL